VRPENTCWWNEDLSLGHPTSGLLSSLLSPHVVSGEQGSSIERGKGVALE